MRRAMFILSAMAMVAAVSCTKEIVDANKESASEVELFPMTFTASSQQTKAEMVDAQTIHWQAGDQINVFDGTETVYEPFTTSGEGASVTFEGMAGKAEGYYALYPYQSSATMTDGAIKATFPSVQTAVAGSFDPKAFISVAQSDAEGNFSFKNVAALVKFTMPENASSATLTANADEEMLCGPVKITFDDYGNPSATDDGKMTNAVTLKGELKAGMTYYFVVRPGIAFSEGLTISIDGKKYRTSSSAPEKTLVRNSVMALPEFTFKGGMPKDLYTAYEHGFDLQIGGQTFDKATYGAATLITEPITAPNAGIYFLNPDVEQPMGSNIKQMAIIGRYADQRTVLTRKGLSYISGTTDSNNYLILANVEYKVSDLGTNKYYLGVNNTDAFENLVFDNLKVELPNAISLVTCSNNDNRALKTVVLMNSEIKVGASGESASYTGTTTAITYLIKSDAETTDSVDKGMTSITIKNNVISGDGDVKRFRVFSAEKVDVPNLTMNDNTIVNCYPYYGYVASATGAYEINEVKGNLFYVPNYDKVAQWYAIVYPKGEQGNTDPYKAVATEKFSDNTAYYGGTTPAKYLRSLYGIGTNSPTALAADPLN